MKTIILVIAAIAIRTVSFGQDAKAHLRDFTSKYTIDTFQLNGESGYLKQRVILFQQADGIRSAYWDDESNILTVQYNNKLIQLSAIKNFFFNNQPIAVLEQKKGLSLNRPLLFYSIQTNSKTLKSKK